MNKQLPLREQWRVVREALSTSKGRRRFVTETLWAAPAVLMACIGILAVLLALPFAFMPGNVITQLQSATIGQLMPVLEPFIRRGLVCVCILAVPLAVIGEVAKLVRQHVEKTAAV